MSGVYRSMNSYGLQTSDFCQLSHGWWVESIEAWSLIFDQLWVIESDYKDFYVCLAMDDEWRVLKHDQLWITDDIGNPAFTYIKLCL